MNRDRDNLLRGQGLFKQGIAGLIARWRAYAWTVGGMAGLGALAVAQHNAPPSLFTCSYQHAQGEVVTWFASGASDPDVNVTIAGRALVLPASVLANHPVFRLCGDMLVDRLVLGGTLGALLGIAICVAAAFWLRDRGREAALDRIIAGTRIVSERQLRSLTRKATSERSIRIATVGIPSWLECRHFAFLGTTGAGKTTVLRQMLDKVEARGEPALVYDTSGEFIAHYYRPERGDVILNPFDARSAYWSPFLEIDHPADADRIARQLVSETGERDDDVWLETSRILVANILRVLNAEGRTTLPDLLNALQAKGKEEMKVWLAGTSSARTFEDDADRATGSVLFMLAKASNLLQFLWREPGETGSFSFRDFIKGLDGHEGPKPWIFVPRKEDYFEAMKPLLVLARMRCQCNTRLRTLPRSPPVVLSRRAGRPAPGRQPHPAPARRPQVRCKRCPDLPGDRADAPALWSRQRRSPARLLQFQALSPADRPRHPQVGVREHRRCRGRGAQPFRQLRVRPQQRTHIGWQHAPGALCRDRERHAARTAPGLPAIARCAARGKDQADPRAYRCAWGRPSARLHSCRCQQIALGQAAEQERGGRCDDQTAGTGVMVATVSALSSSAQAASYYEADDYYTDGGVSPSEWQGDGARQLGLSGEVDREVFRELLDGRLPDGQQLGTSRSGKIEHRPGWDVTMSAPKSVSIMAEVAGDRRLIAAHDTAVKTALAFAERHASATRVRTDGSVERQQTGNLAIANFRHDTSRAQDPQLHTHNVVLNLTRDAQGIWRSLEPRALYQLQKAIGAVYRQELAIGVRALGYAIDKGKDSAFEIKGVSADVIRAFSERAAQVEARLAERGQTRETASAQEKQIAALDTRAAKEDLRREDLVKAWRATADSAGFGAEVRQALVAEAKELATNPEHRAALAAAGQLAAHQAVAFAAESLGERQAVFAAAELEKEAGRFGLGRVTARQIGDAIARATQEGALVPRTFLDKRGAEFAGFTTATNITHERQLLRREMEGRGAVPPIMSARQATGAVARAELRSEHPWNFGQREATRALLTSPDRVTGLQGYAGTAKTTTVLATVAREAAAKGVKVTALAPTASAAQTLGDALGMRGETVARHLLGNTARQNAGLWIVDEASMLSARDMAALLDRAASAGARLLVVGDVKQLGSVGAGAAFAQLQAAGLRTAKLDEIVRQINMATKEAVLASIAGDARKALDALDRGGGRIVEAATREERFTAMARTYAALSPQERARTLVIEPSREGRDVLTAEIRRELASKGELSGPAVTLQSLVAKNLSGAEARDPMSYARGDMVRFARDYADKGVRRDGVYRVEAVDQTKAAITLASPNGNRIDWRLRQWGAGKVEVFETKAIELRTGDRVQFTRNDREAGRINGLGGSVTGVDVDRNMATLKLNNGRVQQLDLADPRDAHLRHGWVQTAHAAQGQTSERVMVHADSRSTNLVDQRMLYVALSRATGEAVIVTDDRAQLIRGLEERSGERQVALRAFEASSVKSKGMDGGLG